MGARNLVPWRRRWRPSRAAAVSGDRRRSWEHGRETASESGRPIRCDARVEQSLRRLVGARLAVAAAALVRWLGASGSERHVGEGRHPASPALVPGGAGRRSSGASNH
ncbi:unnamed protein product [Lampetra fluviatilis]